MRLELFYNPRLLIERLAIASHRHRRMDKLRATVASKLKLGHIDCLELLELIKPSHPKVIYDIGANVGTWTLLAKAYFPEVVIHAFEPLIIHHKSFEEATQALTNLALHKVALGSSNYTVSMQVASFSDASSLLEISENMYNTFGVTKEREEQVIVVSLDEYVQANNLALPDLIKLDIQGYELEALRGASRCLSHAKWLISEVSFVEFYQDQPLFHDVINFLHQRDFYLHALGINTPLGKELSQIDALFIHKLS